MPGRNILKQDVPDSYYHVYARGTNKESIFHDSLDYVFFLSLLKRHLSAKDIANTRGERYVKLHEGVQLISYCLMPNHFHLLLYQITPTTMSGLMRRVMGAYSHYFNAKYRRSGHLFESRYRASRVTSDEYLTHITRYIHLNPDNWRIYPYSSVNYYLGKPCPDWLHPEPIKQLFTSTENYLTFLENYKEHRVILEILKHELADER